ncbi:aldo/keto reductase [Atlantibacter subterranea]|jgi:diketogulonate reductase-like aldo/keto reductase|uniref:Aldo/keto reductase n=1 Tax=Atlantibacter subterraneus TaxID=255519 RepID=A0A427UY47_9ENTR|nr:aldo/keto reductase [Atlantibacter subterranea]MDA3135347.1 aldo/keto reductase [Atlantibacter subterranea]RSB65591.1 aldo/keto reductase [Atlantibacter subterranea]RSE08354.1 aldo/keto reductase [Atlantibacter subterranea]RSE25390.1 aldo/keto reductase [Atlantibacter subterranea]TSJ51973.1 aldo/keto reductase [Atlantibacter subterranea]
MNSHQLRYFFSHPSPIPAIGQGTWYMGENAAQRRQEVAALQRGIDLGLTLIDTAEMYAEGGAEHVVGEAIRGRRDEVYLVSKVYPWNAGGQKAQAACEASLKRLGTDYLDLYLLHWRGNIPFEDTIAAMESLMAQGKIGRWGVSNLDADDMQTLWMLQGGKECATNQVLYHLGSRGIEYDLLPWCAERHMPVMAYCPLAQAGRLRDDLMNDPVVNAIARDKGVTAAQVLLAWVIRRPGVLAIPKASTIEHVEENAAALDVKLTAQDIEQLDAAFPPPGRKMPLDVV